MSLASLKDILRFGLDMGLVMVFQVVKRYHA